jgi:hypothetical protein
MKVEHESHDVPSPIQIRHSAPRHSSAPIVSQISGLNSFRVTVMSNETTVAVNGRRVQPQEAAASRLGCSLPTLRRLVAAGQLTPIRAFGRCWFDDDELEALAARRQPTARIVRSRT